MPSKKEGGGKNHCYISMEIPHLQYLAYINEGKLDSTCKEWQPGLISMGNHWLGKNAEEAELNGKEGTTRGSFQQEITSLGVLNWISSFQIHTLQDFVSQ